MHLKTVRQRIHFLIRLVPSDNLVEQPVIQQITHSINSMDNAIHCMQSKMLVIAILLQD